MSDRLIREHVASDRAIASLLKEQRRTVCCEKMKLHLFPAKKAELYIRIRHQDGYWAIIIDHQSSLRSWVWERVVITYCPFCGTLLEA